MIRSFGLAAATLALAVLVPGTSDAQTSCDPGKPGSELTNEEARAVYDCLEAELVAGYKKGGKRWIPVEFVEEYRSWTPVSKFPGAPGFHGGRFLVAFANEVGASEYLQYKEEDVHMPAGSVIAKESFSVDEDGKVAKGPLFIMQKVEAGTSPETDDWYYMMVSPGGAPVAVDAVAACSVCHLENFGHRGGLGYPIPEARITE